MEKTFYFKLKIEWNGLIEAESVEDAIENIKGHYEYYHNIDVSDDEIVLVEEKEKD